MPPGFERITTRPGYFDELGPVYGRHDAEGTVIALHVTERHLNSGGIAHGGMLATLADSAMGINVYLARPPERRGRQVTVSMTLNYLAPARLGDWVEAHVRLRRTGRRLVFVDCSLRVGEQEVLTGSGVFSLSEPKAGPAQSR